MSKSPMKDFSRLIETQAKTVKKEEPRREEPAYPAQLLRYDVSPRLPRPPPSSTTSRPNSMPPSDTTPAYSTKTPPSEKWLTISSTS